MSCRLGLQCCFDDDDFYRCVRSDVLNEVLLYEVMITRCDKYRTMPLLRSIPRRRMVNLRIDPRGFSFSSIYRLILKLNYLLTYLLRWPNP
jgi:hypothetical protein